MKEQKKVIIDRDGITRYVAKHTGLRMEQAENLTKIVLYTIGDLLVGGADVLIQQMGTFVSKWVEECELHGKKIPAHHTVKFRCRVEFQQHCLEKQRYLPFNDNVILGCLPHTWVDEHKTDEENIANAIEMQKEVRKKRNEEVRKREAKKGIKREFKKKK